MILSRHRFARTFAESLAAPAAHEATMIEEKLQQTQPSADSCPPADSVFLKYLTILDEQLHD